MHSMIMLGSPIWWALPKEFHHVAIAPSINIVDLNSFPPDRELIKQSLTLWFRQRVLISTLLLQVGTWSTEHGLDIKVEYKFFTIIPRDWTFICFLSD